MSTLDTVEERTAGGLDPFKAMRILDNTDRKNIIGTIVGHAKSAPSQKEIRYYNPSITSSSLSRHLQTLEKNGLIKSAERSREGLPRGKAYKFYRLTPAARELFDDLNVFGPEPYQNLLEQVEKTPEIEAAENELRPDFD